MGKRFDSDIHKRQSIRLKGYDYSKEGLYFITIGTQNMGYLFGEIIENKMELNYAGRLIEKCWKEIPEYYSGFELHGYIVMPNHIHGIIEIVDKAEEHLKIQGRDRTLPVQRQKQLSISELIQRYKTLTTNRYIKAVKDGILPSFDRRIWHRNYYENIIRNEEKYERVVNYIRNNPRNWKEDRFYERFK